VAQGVPPRRSARLPERGRRGQSDDQGRRGRPERTSRSYPDAFDDRADDDMPPWAGPGIYPTGPGGRERRPRPAGAYDDGRAGSAGPAPRQRSEPPDSGGEDFAPDEGGRRGRRGPDGGGRGGGRASRRAAAAKARKSRREIIIAGLVVVVGVVVVLGVLGKLPFQGKPAKSSQSNQFVTTFQPGEFRSVPNACDAVGSATISQFLPGKVSKVSQGLGGATQSQCTWTLDAKPVFRVLTVTSQAFTPSLLASGDGSATFSAIDAYNNELQNLQHPAKSTKAPKALIGGAVGLGRTAFTAQQVFHQGGGTIDDEVTVVVRDRNVLITVAVQGQAHGGGFGPVSEATLRAAALAAAHDALAGLR
jgi:hypothetical protein